MNSINYKKFDLVVNIRNNRIWLPKNIQKIIRERFIEIRIKNVVFVTKLTKDGRFFIPKRLRKNISNKPSKIKILVLKNLERPKKFTLNGKIDVLAFVPQKTLSGFEILALEEKNKLRLWYSTKGRPNEIVISRFVPLKFIRLLGYYQAEGGKVKLKKRRGREINFTNANFDLIEDFLGHFKDLVDIELCKSTIRYNSKIRQYKISEIKNKLISSGINEENIRSKQARRIKNWTIKIWITNSILAETMNNMMNKFREHLFKNDVNKELLVYFLQGLLAGDGNFYSSRDKKGCLHSYLRVFEFSDEFINDYREIFKRLGINGKIRKAKDKNFYIYEFFVNWGLLLKLLKLGLLKKSLPNHKRLVNAIKQHRSYKFGWLTEEQLNNLISVETI